MICLFVSFEVGSIELLGYDLNGKFKVSSPKYFKTYQLKGLETYDKESNTKSILLKPLTDPKGLKTLEVTGRIWKDNLVSLRFYFGKLNNNKVEVFDSEQECEKYIYQSIEYFKKSYRLQFEERKDTKRKMFEVFGNSIFQGNFDCSFAAFQKHYDSEGNYRYLPRKKEGRVITLHVNGSKWIEKEIKYREKKEKNIQNKLSPFGINFGKVNISKYEITDKIEHFEDIISIYIKNPDYPLSFFDDGLYAFNMVENEIFKIQVARKFSSDELENFENIFNELIQKYENFLLSNYSKKNQKYKSPFIIKNFLEFQKLVKNYESFYLSSSYNDNEHYRIWINVMNNEDSSISLSLNYVNELFDLKRRKKLHELSQTKDNYKKSL